MFHVSQGTYKHRLGAGNRFFQGGDTQCSLKATYNSLPEDGSPEACFYSVFNPFLTISVFCEDKHATFHPSVIRS